MLAVRLYSDTRLVAQLRIWHLLRADVWRVKTQTHLPASKFVLRWFAEGQINAYISIRFM